jgi:hypothetical protein
MHFPRIITICASLIIVISVFPQVTDSTYNNDIHTIQILKAGWELSVPVAFLNSDDQLLISFDDFSDKVKNYWYSLEHCNHSWVPDQMPYDEFYDGFETNQINNYAFSTNTLINYIHYSFLLPNENCHFKVSGNYLLKVFEDNDPQKLIFTKKIYIAENTAQILFQLIRPEIPRYMMKYQQFKAIIQPNCGDALNLRSEIITLIMQNFNTLTLRECYLSELRNNSILVYDDPDSNLFLGVNEFRHFDTKSLKSTTDRIQSTTYLNQYYEAYLTPDDWRNKLPYSSVKDINGKYIIANQKGTNKDIDADYIMIHFKLPLLQPLLEGNLYLMGAFTDWKCNEYSQMHYDTVQSAYIADLLLKQGYYNYQIIMKANDGAIDFSYVEGSHFETENDYCLFVYYNSAFSRYERLIGYTSANTYIK